MLPPEKRPPWIERGDVGDGRWVPRSSLRNKPRPLTVQCVPVMDSGRSCIRSPAASRDRGPDARSAFPPHLRARTQNVCPWSSVKLTPLGWSTFPVPAEIVPPNSESMFPREGGRDVASALALSATKIANRHFLREIRVGHSVFRGKVSVPVPGECRSAAEAERSPVQGQVCFPHKLDSGQHCCRPAFRGTACTLTLKLTGMVNGMAMLLVPAVVGRRSVRSSSVSCGAGGAEASRMAGGPQIQHAPYWICNRLPSHFHGKARIPSRTAEA